MKHIISILKMEMLHIGRDIHTFFFAIVMPVLMMIVFGLIITIDINCIDIAVVVPHPTTETRQYLEPLRHNSLFRFKGEYTSASDCQNMIRRGELDAYIVLHPDFGRLSTVNSQTAELANRQTAKVQIVTDGTNPFVSKATSGYIQAALEEDENSLSQVSVNMLHNPRLQSAYNFGPGIIGYTLILICLLLSSSSIASEKDFSTIYPVILSHIQPWEMMVAKLIPCLLIGLLAFVLSLFEGHLLLGIPLNGSFLSVLLITVLYIITSILTGAVFALFTASRTNAFVVGVGFTSITVSCFCGMVTPFENLPVWAQMIGYTLYPTHYISALRKLMIEGVAFSDVLRQVSLILLTACLLLLVCLFRLKGDRWLR